jgi:hypothetical protein
MKIKLLKNIGIAGKHTKEGTVVDVSDRLGLELIGNGRAVLADAEPVKEEAPAEPVKEEAPANDEVVDTLPEEAKPAKKK